MKQVSLEELLEAGSHFGHQKRRWNPSMQDYIYGERDGVHIFDLVKTKAGLEAACEYVENLVKNGGTVMFVGTKRQAEEAIKREAVKAGMPYMNVRWMGGLFTNFPQLSRRIRKLSELKSKRESGELKKYTKKERLLIDREIQKLEKFFGGVSDMEKLPEAIFVVDTHKEDVAVREAARMGIKVIGMVDTNGDPGMVDYVIPANDDAAKSIELVINCISDTIVEARGKETKKSEKPVEKESKVEESQEEKPVKKAAKTKKTE